MIILNSILTAEERALLLSLGCRNKAQAVRVLEDLKMVLPIRSEMFISVLELSNKLNGNIDFAFEMRLAALEAEE